MPTPTTPDLTHSAAFFGSDPADSDEFCVSGQYRPQCPDVGRAARYSRKQLQADGVYGGVLLASELALDVAFSGFNGGAPREPVA